MLYKSSLKCISLNNNFWIKFEQYSWCHVRHKIEATTPTPGHVHYSDVIRSAMVSQFTSLTIVYSSVYSDPDQRKNQSSASLAFVRGIRRWLVNSPYKRPVTWKLFPFDDVIMISNIIPLHEIHIPHPVHLTVIYFHRTKFCKSHPDENVLKPITKFPISYFD